MVVLLFMAFGWIRYRLAENYLDNLYHEPLVAYPFIVCTILMLIVCVRLFYLALRRTDRSFPSIDRATEFGDVRISFDTIKSLALKAAGQIQGLSEVKTRLRVSDVGLEIDMRAAVSGDTAIPELTEQLQRTVKFHVEEMTGITVAAVSVFVSNVVTPSPSSSLFKSRVE